MANSVPDILEITAVHGTQAVFIKKEMDEGDTEEFKEDIILNTLRNDLLSVPLIYTTRLDEMNAFKKIERYTSKEATEMILIESKPRYKHIRKQIKREPISDPYITSFIQLCSHVQELNTKVKSEAYNTYLRNEKLVKMCKPLKIVLEKVKSNTLKLPRMKISECKEFNNCSSGEDTPLSFISDVDGHSSWSSDEDVALSKSMSHCDRINKADTSKNTSDTILAIKEKRSQEADIYILDASKGVKSYYRSSIKECDKLQKRHLCKRKVILECCCWVNREKRIINFIQTDFDGANVSKFLRKPHNCLPRPCTCCCVLGTPIPKNQASNKNSEFTQPNKKSVIEVSMSRNVLIEKAYVYSKKEFNTVHNTKNLQTDAESTIYLKCAVIIIKYQRVIFAQTELFGENYEIGSKGDIDQFMKLTVNRSITEEKELYRKNDEDNKVNRKYFTYLICCWHMREKIIAQLHDYNKMSSKALRFIQNPHPCRSDKCECCCKPTPSFSLLSENISISIQKNTVHSKKQMKVKQAKPRKTKNISNPTSTNHDSFKEHIDIDTENLKITEEVIKRTSKPSETITKNRIKPRATQNITQNDRHTFDFIEPNKIQDGIDLTIDSTFQSNQIPTNPPNCDSNNYTDTTHSLTTPPSNLTDSILDKFIDLKLAVNDNRKLIAMINTPPGKLSAAEIKVLSDILTLAATQIEKLGITPEEFCKRVNSKAITCPSSLVMPPLVPILDSPIVNKATLNASDHRTMPKLNTSNLTCTDKQSQNVTTCDSRRCKAHSLNISFPKTHNKSIASGFYQMMSSLGGIKNQHLVYAYRQHFKEKNVTKPTTVQEKQNLIPKFSNGCTLVEEVPKVNRKRAHAPTKIKNPQKTKQMKTQKKQCVITPEDISKRRPQNLQKLQKLKVPFKSSANNVILNEMDDPQLVIGGDNNPTPLFVRDTNLISVHNTIGADVSESIMGPPHSQLPFIVSNSNLIPIHNASSKDVQQPMMGVDLNPPPLFVSNTNSIPNLNASGTSISESVLKAQYNQISNSHFIPINNTIGKDVKQPIVGADGNPPQFLVSNSNYLPIQNTIDTIVSASLMGDHDSQIPFFVSNGNIIPVHSTRGTDVQQPMIGADHNPPPLLVNIANIIPVVNKSGMDIPGSNSDAQQSVSNANLIPSNTDTPGMLVDEKNTSPCTDSPLLSQMLAKTSGLPPLPPLLPPLSLRSHKGGSRGGAREIKPSPKASESTFESQFMGLNYPKNKLSPFQTKILDPPLRSHASKQVGRPLILAHSKGSIQKAQHKRKILEAPKDAVQLKENSRINSRDMDFESSLKTNVIEMGSDDQTFKGEVTHVSNNIPITVIDYAEEEGIFGV